MHAVFVSFAAAFLGYSSASAAELTALPLDMPSSFSDDVEAGHFLEKQVDLPCGANTLRATMRVENLHADKHWAASMRIGLYEEEMRHDGKRDLSKRYVSLILGLVDEGDPLKFELQKMEGAKELQHMGFSVQDAQGRSFPVEATWTADGTIDFAIDGQPLKPISLDHAPASITFVISGAKGEFSDIQVGRSGVPDAACTPSAAHP